MFETYDEPIFIGVVSDAAWQKLCALFDLAELSADQSLRTNNQRVLARDRILPQVRELVASMTREEIMARLEVTGLPFAPIARPEDMFDDAQLAHGGLEAVTLDTGGETWLPTIPLQMGGLRPGAPVTLPLPGADSRDVLAALGYSQERIDTLVAQGAVGAD